MQDFKNIADPLEMVRKWVGEAKADTRLIEPTAMALATVGADGRPSARVVLLKGLDHGLVFYTNLASRKSEELKRHPHAALCFWWPTLMRQLRVEGSVEPVGAREADEYFASRPRESQLGAWASDQSRVLESREALVARLKEAEARFAGKPVPRPSHWSGWRVVPQRIEFWQQGEARLHHRTLFTRAGKGWQGQMLFP